MSLMGVPFPINSLLHWIAPSNEHLFSAVLKRHRSREGPSHCGGVLVGCQGEGLSVTSACDIGAVCHVGLFLLHAVMAKGWPSSSLPTLSNRLTHAPGSFVPFRRLHGRRQLRSGACFTPRRAWVVKMFTIQLIGRFVGELEDTSSRTAASRSVSTHILSTSARWVFSLSDLSAVGCSSGKHMGSYIIKYSITRLRMAQQWFWPKVLCLRSNSKMSNFS